MDDVYENCHIMHIEHRSQRCRNILDTLS